jgi:AcrR family transcriptional regulator
MTAVDSSRVETSEVARHIARVAARLFATQGYDATSVRTIVEEAGVTKPTLYYYYGSKEGLAQALCMMPMAALNETLRKILDEVHDPVEMVVQAIEAHFDFCREDPDRSRFVFALFFGPPTSELLGHLQRFKGGMDCSMEQVFARAADAGLIEPERLESFARTCMGLIIISMMGFLYKQGDLEPGLARRLVGDLLRGFGTPEFLGRGS